MYRFIENYIRLHFSQLIRFTIVGFTALGINLFCFHVFYDYISLDYRVAVSISYVITVGIHFLLHRLFTFRAAGQDLVHNTWKYLTMLGLNYVLTLLAVWLTVNVVKSSPYVGLIASTALTAGMSFLVMNHFVFKTREVA